MLWNVVKFRRMLWKKQNVVKCCENRFHNISQHFTTFWTRAENLTITCPWRLQKRQLQPSNNRTYGLFRKSLYTVFSERPLNVVKSRTGKNHPILMIWASPEREFHNIFGFSQHFTTFRWFSQHCRRRGKVRQKVEIEPFRLRRGSSPESDSI